MVLDEEEFAAYERVRKGGRVNADILLLLGVIEEQNSIPKTITFPNGWETKVVDTLNPGEILTYKPVDHKVAAPLIMAYPDAQISPHFRLSEFRPARHMYEYMRLSPKLVEVLERIRNHVGRPVTIMSGYRPSDYNREVGGVSNSTHMDGLAADINCDGISTHELYDAVDLIVKNSGGVGFYPRDGYVHVDVRGYHCRWSGA